MRGVLLFLLAGPALAAEHGPAVRTGTEGLEAVSLQVANAGAVPIACEAQIAHWFALPVALADPGQVAEAVLWRDPVTGTVHLTNDRGEALPVERLWCGLAGRTWATRAPVAIDRGRAEAPIRLSCTAADDRLLCGDAHRP